MAGAGMNPVPGGALDLGDEVGVELGVELGVGCAVAEATLLEPEP